MTKMIGALKYYLFNVEELDKKRVLFTGFNGEKYTFTIDS